VSLLYLLMLSTAVLRDVKIKALRRRVVRLHGWSTGGRRTVVTISSSIFRFPRKPKLRWLLGGALK